MPWNTASRHGSARPFGSGLSLPGGVGISSSVAGVAGGMELGPPSALGGRRAARLTSASPLLGRGAMMPHRYSSLELPGSEQAKLTSGAGADFGFDDAGLPFRGLGNDILEKDPEFQLYGPGAAVDTQTAQQSQWVAKALDTEAHNFLAFVTAEIDAKVAAGGWGEEDEDGGGRVTFEEMLPPEQHSKVVAAQGLLHVLSLATKGLIEVRQEEAFGEIEIGVVSRGNAEGEM